MLTTDEANTQPLGTKATSSTDSVKIGVGISREIVVDGEVDAFNINTSTEDVSRDADTLVELFELFIAFDTEGVSVMIAR